MERTKIKPNEQHKNCTLTVVISVVCFWSKSTQNWLSYCRHGEAVARFYVLYIFSTAYEEAEVPTV